MKKAKIAIIGTGERGRGCFAELLSKRGDVEISAMCDVNRVRLAAAAKAFGVKKTCSSADELFKETSPDGVIVTTPDFTHREIALKALAAKVNVLIDKPLATTVPDCLKVIAAAEKCGKTAMMGFNLRHHEVLLKLKELITSGVLGRIIIMENREFYDGGRTYMGRWNRFFAKSGGLWIHKASHDFDIFNWFLDFPEPKTVSAFAGLNVFTPENIPFPLEKGKIPGPSCSVCAYADQCRDKFTYNPAFWGERAIAADGYVKDTCLYLSEKDVHDNGIAMVEYENGVRASTFECFVTSRSDRVYTIIGTRAHAEASLADRKIRIYPRWSKEVMTIDLPETGGGHGGADPELVESFVKAVLSGSRDISSVRQGIWATAVGQAAELSRREQRTVFVKELFKSTRTGNHSGAERLSSQRSG